VTQHLSNFAIDELASGLVTDARARAHLEGCARCRDELGATEAARAEFARDVFPRTVGRLRVPRKRWWRVPAIAVSFAAALVLWLWSGHRTHSSDSEIAIKGEVTFRVFAKRGDAVFAVRDATRLAPGDRIRFVAGSRNPGYLLVVSIDGAGAATVYYPFGGERSAAIGSEQDELPGSIVLDRAPGPERVFALFSAQPLDAAPVLRALHQLGARGAAAIRDARTLDVACAQASVVFDKDVP
jgi:hypothetical protein